MTSQTDTNAADLQTAVREKYGAIAKSVGGAQGCCGSVACCGGGEGDPISSQLYPVSQTRDLPAEAVAVSLGCGNPTALLPLEAGQTVLDLGSGGGIDVLLSAKRVGPAGKVYGLDMTDEMLALARENRRKAGATNVEFLKGTIEEKDYTSKLAAAGFVDIDLDVWRVYDTNTITASLDYARDAVDVSFASAFIRARKP